MIAKISATENLGGALGYNFKKVNKKEATLLLAHGLYQNRAGEYTMSEVLADMQALIPEKCRTKKMVFHCSLNPHLDEKLSDETLSLRVLRHGSNNLYMVCHRLATLILHILLVISVVY